PIMPSNKARLYVALYVRGGAAKMPGKEDTYGWNCVLWIKEALSELQTSTNIIGTNVLEWEAVRNAAMSCCQQKKDEHRFDGTVHVDTLRVPTYDLIQGKETIS
ncbi:unnamed protein product, partial [Aureobasidium mustum]